MKKTVIFGLVLLFIIMIIPALSGIGAVDTGYNKNNVSSKKSTTDQVSASSDDEKIIICTALNYIDNNSNTEYKTALLALCKNNYLYCKANNIPTQSDIYNYSDSDYKELRSIYNEMNTTLTYNNKTVYIPILKSGGNKTSTSDEYPYISCVASPWDAYCYDYNDDIEYPCGISLFGIGYLCSQGYSAAQALGWYLPLFEIK